MLQNQSLGVVSQRKRLSLKSLEARQIANV
jgi:hypothetical protein